MLILLLSALAFAHLDADNLTHVDLPFVGGQGSDASSLALVFGVTFTAYFGHLSVSNCARVVLARDPSGRTLVRGVVGAQLTAIALYVLFVVAVAGAVAPAVLSGEAGTALSPLADEAGAAVLLLGGMLVVLGMGMASIHSALALFYLVRERLPSRAPVTLVLPRRGARIVLESRRRRDRTSVALTYLGATRGAAAVPPRGRARRADAARRGDGAEHRRLGAGRRRAAGAAHPGHDRSRGAPRARDLDAAALRGRVRQRRREPVRDPRAARPRGRRAGLDHAPAGRERRRGRRADRARRGRRRGDARRLGARRPARGASRGGERRYVARAGRRRGGRLPAEMWEALGVAEPRRPPPSRRRPRAQAGARLPSASAAASWPGSARSSRSSSSPPRQATTGAVSLADVLSFLGVIIVALLAGVFPVLLLVGGAAARRARRVGLPAAGPALGARRGLRDRARRRRPARAGHLGRPAAARVRAARHRARAGDDRDMARDGAFAPRATVQLRHEVETDTGWLSLVVAGRPVHGRGRARVRRRRAGRARGGRRDPALLGAARRDLHAGLGRRRRARARRAEGLGASRQRRGGVRAAGGRARARSGRRVRRSSSSRTPRRRSASDRGADLVERGRQLAAQDLEATPVRRAERGEALRALRRPRPAAARRPRGRRRGCGAPGGGRRRRRAPRRPRPAPRRRRASSRGTRRAPRRRAARRRRSAPRARRGRSDRRRRTPGAGGCGASGAATAGHVRCGSQRRSRPARNGIVVGLAAKSSIPAARQRSGSPCMTLAVSAMIGIGSAPVSRSWARIASRELEAVHPRHVQVGQHERVVAAEEALEAVVAVDRGVGLEADRLQLRAQHRAVDGVVLDEQQEAALARGLLARRQRAARRRAGREAPPARSGSTSRGVAERAAAASASSSCPRPACCASSRRRPSAPPGACR